MPPSTPTLRQQRLGAELRKLREHAGLTSSAAAELLGVKQAQISSIEAGRYAVSADRVRTFARAYSCADPALVDALAAMTGGRTRGWWDEYREHLPVGLIDLAELEHYATELRAALVIHIPALLQTTEHARALFKEAVPPLRPYEIEHRLSHRIKRQGVLHRQNPPPYTAVIHECAFHMGYGGPATVRAQLRHLLDMSELDRVTVRIIPMGSGSFPGNGQSIDYLSGDVPQLDTVQLDTHHGCEFLDGAAQLEKYRSVLEGMEVKAFKPADSRDLLHRLIQTI
ncbi:helix-turn-helix domain-containing protein [Streptomyces phaeolivaceus]|uniref:Helix-turn-helix domain-containing protein n=1 Tax=Streptomyces phaeolivaceus TaxID=2653200 RepID=A0A5P8K4W1_9ACTN|nr:helix-turn-helix transcriptional regulator [Streptomyces phaeolivaceus]QFQ97822.1 helix-turn-helix domain-containing protein [Streptomyces phaeolivaceus]